jgi:hypothetical protein
LYSQAGYVLTIGIFLYFVTIAIRLILFSIKQFMKRK